MKPKKKKKKNLKRFPVVSAKLNSNSLVAVICGIKVVKSVDRVKYVSRKRE